MSCFFDVQDKFEINYFKLTPVYLVREMLLISSLSPFSFFISLGATSFFKRSTSQLLCTRYSMFIIAHFQYLYSTLRYGITLKMMRIDSIEMN